MKTRIFNIFIILITVLLLSAATVSQDFSIALGDEFVSVQSGDNLDTVSQKLSLTTAQLKSYFDDGLLYLAVTDDGKTQIKISAYTNNFSSEVVDISNLDDQMLYKFADTIDDKSASPATIVSNRDRKYVCIKDVHKDSGGIYTVTQYVTICNKKTYHFVAYNDGEDTSDLINSAFESFEIANQQKPSSKYTPKLIIIMIGIVLFSIIAIVMVVGIIKQARSHTEEGEPTDNEIQ